MQQLTTRYPTNYLVLRIFFSKKRSHFASAITTCLYKELLRYHSSSTNNTHTPTLSEPLESLQAQGIVNGESLLKFQTIHELQKHACKVFAKNPLFGTYKSVEDDSLGTFSWMSYQEFGDNVNLCRQVLKNFGIQEYDKVAIISDNRWEWVVIATAAYSLRATLVPMYEAQMSSDWTYILNDSLCSLLFCSTEAIYSRCLTEVLPQTPSVQSVACLNAPIGQLHAFSTLMSTASEQLQNNDPLASIIPPSPDDLANLLYTSGTTGKPKGVELIHSNVTTNVKGIRGMVTPDRIHEFLRTSDRGLAILPWAHTYAQTCELWTDMAHGSSIGIARGVPQLMEDFQLVKPTTLVAVPALFKRIYSAVYQQIDKANFVKQKLMTKALEVGKFYSDAKKRNESLGLIDNLQHSVLDKIILSKIRDKFGSRLRHGFVAGAACPTEVIDFMDSVGLPICEGYGLTETAPIITMNTPYDRMIGSVGRELVGVNVVIMGSDGNPVETGNEGEICCYGPNVMRGYYKNPQATTDVITVAPDGKSRLFHSGDLGVMTPEGFLKVTGRLKEVYKLENGKYVCPTPIEESMSMSKFITQVVLYGFNKPFNIALVVPDWSVLRTELNVEDSVSDEELKNDSRVKTLILTDIQSECVNKVKKYEIPKDLVIVEPFTSENKMLTPKMSIRRHVVVQHYDDIVQGLYEQSDSTER